MPKILALDISTSAGWAFLDEGQPKKLIDFGMIVNEDKISGYGTYPESYVGAAEAMAIRLLELVLRFNPDKIVIEETNKGRSRYTQKILEFIHCTLLILLRRDNHIQKVVYVNTSDWRKITGVELSKEDKKQNTKLSKAKSAAKKKNEKLDKKSLGIRGKITKKHLAIRVANDLYDLQLKPKDDDIADAICIGTAWCYGVKHCDGKK